MRQRAHPTLPGGWRVLALLLTHIRRYLADQRLHRKSGSSSPADPLTGYANADCIEQLGQDELGDYPGSFVTPSMRGVNEPWR